MYLCLVAEQRQGSRVTNQWWEQDVLDVEGIGTVVWEAERMGGEEKDRTETETN